MIWIPLIVLILSIIIYGLCMRYESRTLWSGFGFLGLSILIIFIGIFYSYSTIATKYPVLIDIGLFMAALAALCILFFPLMLIIVYFIEGIRMIRHEGLKATNLLSLTFSLLLIIYLFFWPSSFGKTNIIGDFLYALIGFAVLYCLSLMAIYGLSSFLNTFHLFKKKNLDYIIVLGAGIKGRRVTPLLAARIDKGIDVLKNNPHAVLIMSGGMGRGEDIPEGEAMASYAMEKGINQDQILIEDQSKNTKENLLFSSQLMTIDHPRIALVTTSYHVFRALILAKNLNIRCIGFGAATKWYFTLNAFIREFIGYLSMTWKKHAAVLVVYLLILILFQFI